MGGACPSRASVVPLGGWYSEPTHDPRKTEWYHVAVQVSVETCLPMSQWRSAHDRVRGSGQLIPPNCVEVRFDPKPAQLLKGTIQPDGSIVWDNGRTWERGDARAQRWEPPHSASSVDENPWADLNAWEEARRERLQPQQRPFFGTAMPDAPELRDPDASRREGRGG